MVRIRVRQGKIPPAEGSYLGEKSCPLHLFQLRKPSIRAFRGTLCLLFRERAWYVCVFDRKKSREMVLRASRIRDLHVMEETFERTMQEDPMATPDYSKSYTLQRVVLRIDAECAFRAFDEFPEKDIRPQPDGSFLIDEEMPVNEWLTGYLLSFADGLEVIEPATLRTALKEKIHSMQKKYDKQVSGS